MNIADFIDSMISIAVGVMIYATGMKPGEHSKKMKIAGLVVIVIGMILFFEKMFR